MSSLVGGHYSIEYVTYESLDDIGGMYVTRNRRQEPLIMSAQGAVGRQEWKVSNGPPGSNTYILTPPFDAPGADGFSWEGENPTTIIFDMPRNFTLDQVPPKDVDERQDIYWIRPVLRNIGVDHCVGRDAETEELRVFSFPIGPDNHRRPIWKFRAIN